MRVSFLICIAVGRRLPGENALCNCESSLTSFYLVFYLHPQTPRCAGALSRNVIYALISTHRAPGGFSAATIPSTTLTQHFRLSKTGALLVIMFLIALLLTTTMLPESVTPLPQRDGQYMSESATFPWHDLAHVTKYLSPTIRSLSSPSRFSAHLSRT